MSKHAILAALATSLLISTATAQTFYIPDSTVGGGCNVIPFGTNTVNATWGNQRYQTLATHADLGSPTGVLNICNIGFLSCGTTNNIGHCDTIEVKLAQTSLTTLGTTFATNLGTNNVKTVLKCADYNWHHVGGVFSRIGLDTNYLYLPHATDKNLIIEICVTGNKKCLGSTTGFRTGARQRLFRFTWAASTGCPPTGTTQTAALKWCIDADAWSMEEYGKSCQNLDLSLSGSAQLGQALSITTSGGTGTCAIAIGVGCLNPGFDLGVVGANGCTVYCLPLIIIPGTSLNATVPNDRQLICQRFCVQAFCRSTTYPGGIATSQVGKIMPGLAR